MKKLLSLLSSMTVAASAAMAVVSCSVPSTPITVSFGKGPIDDKGHYTVNDGGKKDKDNNPNEYSMSDIAASMLGNYTGGQEIGTLNFNNLNRGLLSLLSFNQSMIVKTQNNYGDVAAHRDLWQGRDVKKDIAKGENPKDKASIDGIKFGGVDDDDYYKNFSKTQISSLKGLQDLAHAFDSEEKVPDGLKDQWKNAVSIFGYADASKNTDNKDKIDLANTFMSKLLNADGNPSFTKINYGFETSDMVNYNPTSKMIDPFNNLKSVGSSFKLGAATAYKDLNDMIKDKPDKDGLTESDKKINERKSVDPYGALLLPMEDINIDSPDIKVVPSEKDDKDNKDSKDKMLNSTIADATKNLSTYAVEKETDGKFSYSFAGNKFVAKKVKPIDITYTYDTKINKDGKPVDGNVEYKISFKIDKLNAIFMPQVYNVKTLAPVSAKPDKDNAKTIITFNVNNKDFKEDSLEKKINIENSKNITEDKDDATVTYEVENTSGSFTVNNRTYEYDTAAKKETSFSTMALTWAFVGYKFFDVDAAKAEFEDKIAEDENANALTGVQTMIKSDSKQEVFTSEIAHNYKDIKIDVANLKITN